MAPPSDTAHPEGERELLPCPFCGTAPKSRMRQDESLWSHNIVEHLTISCPECDILMSSEEHERIRALWNTRPSPPSRPQGEEGLWRPISEAPTDGTHFLAHYIDLVDEYDEEDRLIARAVPTASIGVAYHVDWLGGILDYPYQGRIVQGRRYTHWQPLPAPPALSNQGKPSS